MNTVIFVGRLVADPVLRHSKSNTPIASFSLAIERTFKQEGQPDVDFFDASAFGNTASYLSQYAVKGSLIEAVGRIEIDHFNSREGEKRTAVRFKIDRAKILASPKARTTYNEDVTVQQDPDENEDFDPYTDTEYSETTGDEHYPF